MASVNNQENQGECRLCGEENSRIRLNINDKIKGSNCCKDYVGFFCRVDLSDAENLPQGICFSCYEIVMKFCQFTTKIEKHQIALGNRTTAAATQSDGGIERREQTSAQVQVEATKKRKRDESSASSSKDASSSSSSNNNSNSRSKSDKASVNSEKPEAFLKNCLTEVMELFEDDIKNRNKAFEKITIKESLLLEGGEISKTWLARYKNFITWQDLPHSCTHCKKNFNSLNSLLMHFDDIKLPVSKRSIKCSLCSTVFRENRYLSTYLNHQDKSHHSHLKFSCLFCKKIFVNAAKLCEHAIEDHGHLKFKLYPCLNCGLACPTIDALARHKTCHD
jgi:hypothetical protein